MIQGMSNTTITLYGIPNCDTVKKARAWFAAQAVNVSFVDFKKQGVPEGRLPDWIAAVGWEKLINRQGTTWRKLDENIKAGVIDPASAAALALTQASVIKRPVVEWPNGDITVGFDAADWAQRLS